MGKMSARMADPYIMHHQAQNTCCHLPSGKS
jgi:hypothetical protein